MKKALLKLSLVFTFCLLLGTIISSSAITVFATETSEFSGGNGTKNDPYQISTETQLKSVKNNLNAYYILVSDIELSSSSWTPIGDEQKPFTGGFNGNGYTIKNFKLSDIEQENTHYIGLFGVNDGAISDLNLQGTLEFESAGRYTSINVSMGAIAGLNNGTITNCTTNCSLLAHQRYFDCGLSANVGGICGSNTGIIGKCYNESNIVTNCKYTKIGGICGNSSGAITQCVNMGTLSTDIDNAYSHCCFSAKVGGITGYTSGGSIQECFNAGSVDMIVYTRQTAYDVNTGNWIETRYKYSCDGVSGGIVGNADGESVISNCYNIADLHTNITGRVADGYTTGEVGSGTRSTGGICGLSDGNSSVLNCYNLGNILLPGYSCEKGVVVGKGNISSNCYHLSHLTGDTLGSSSRAFYEFKDKSSLNLLDFDNVWCYREGLYPYPQLKSLLIDDSIYSKYFNEQKEIVIEYNLLDESETTFKEAHLEGTKILVTSYTPQQSDLIFVGWNTISDLNKIYNSNEEYHGTGETLYAMWAPACTSCKGLGSFSQNSSCQTCGGDGICTSSTRKCNVCYSTNVVHSVTGYGSFYYCASCASTNVSISSNTSKCSNCNNGIVLTSQKCTVCNGRKYENVAPTVISYSDSKVILLNISEFEYSCDGIHWQDSNIFTNLSPATKYVFYQRHKGDEHSPFGVISEPTSLVTDKELNLNIPARPVAQEIGADYVLLEQIANCEYSIDGTNWQASPFFDGLNIATEYIFYIRYSETSTSYPSDKSDATIIKTDKGVHTSPATPLLLEKMYNKIILVNMEGYEYSCNLVDWQKSSIFCNLDSNTNYTFYCRKVENDFYYTSAPSAPLNVKTEPKTGTPLKYWVVFKSFDGSVISEVQYEKYDVVEIPQPPTIQNDKIGSYTFVGWDKQVEEYCLQSITYTAQYQITHTDYTVIFKNEDGTVLSTNTYHYGDEVTVPETPTKATDNTYTYTFKSWDNEVVACAGNATYTAIYTATAIEDTNTPGTDTEPNDPDTDVNTPSDNDTNDENEGLSGGAIAGIAAGSTVAVGAGGFSLFWFVIKKKKFADLIKIIKK